jgi:uncharacterized protein YuzE
VTINYEELIGLLSEHGKWGADDIPPGEALYISFHPNPDEMMVQSSITSETSGGSNMVIDVDEHGRILGLEITTGSIIAGE